MVPSTSILCVKKQTLRFLFTYMLGPELGFGTTMRREPHSLPSRSFQYSERDRCINSDMKYENFSVLDIYRENLLKMRPEWWAGMRWTMNAEAILKISTKPKQQEH